MSLISSLRSSVQELTGYFLYLLLVSTLGPLLFGFHLVCFQTLADANWYPSKTFR